MRELYEAGVGAITAYAVHGISGETTTFLSSKRPFEVNHLPESVKLEVVCSEESLDKIIQFIAGAAREGHKRTRIISRPVINEKTAARVKRIFDEFERHNGYKAIAMRLNDEGYRTEQGNRFRFQHIARILRNKAYIGVLEFHIRQDRAAREPLIIPAFYPPIIEDDQFNRVQEKLKALLPYWQNAHAHRTEYLLSTLVVCDRCNHRYVGTAAKSGRFHYYTHVSPT
jgi:nitrogen regulatory protein PII